ncbi:MAG: glycosyltransferase family 39 protein, partial [Bacteroidia bacterium]|nr:glycosyltransferase family 39 protein [Bacteroidia bacterium]
PDTPLIFFTALFFLCYKKFVNNLSLQNSLLLGISIALLFYSKYHATLIVFFTLLSNIRLFTKYQTYIAGTIAMFLFAPHLWWQYQHDWISFRYHLFESNVNPFKISFTGNYILGQLLLPGPVAGFIILSAAFLYKPTNEMEKALRYTMIGIYGFFLLSSFRGKVEANWTSPVLISLMVLSHQFMYEKFKWQKILFLLLPITLILVLFARIIMIVDILPVKAIKERYHSWKGWPEEMREKTTGLPIVFSNSYQRASKYWFYSGQMTYSQNWYKKRKNNYNFWPIEDSLLGKPVYFLDYYRSNRFPDSLKTPIGLIGFRYDSSFAFFARITISTDTKKIVIKEGEEILLKCHFEIPTNYSSFIRSHRFLNDTTRIGIFNSKGWIKDVFTGLSLQQMNEQKEIELQIIPKLPAGKYYLLFSINSGDYKGTHNSNKIELVIK